MAAIAGRCRVSGSVRACLIGACAALLALAPLPRAVRAQEPADAQAIRDSVSRFERQYVRGEEQIQARMVRGYARQLSVVAREAAYSLSPAYASFLHAFQVFALRGVAVCRYLTDAEPVRGEAMRMGAPGATWNLAKQATLFPLHNVSLAVGAITPTADGARVRIDFLPMAEAPAAAKPFSEEVVMMRGGTTWAVDYASFAAAIDRHWDELALGYLPTIASTTEWQSQGPEERRLTAAYALAMAETLRHVTARCPRFRDAEAAVRRGVEPDPSAPLKAGLGELVALPVRDWPEPEALPWWAEQKL